MSLSGISFAGLGSGLDTQSIVAQLMRIEQLPVTRMQNQKANLQNRLSIYDQLKSKFTAMNGAAAALNTASAFSPVKSSITDGSIASFTPGSNTPAGTYQLTVTQLAAANKATSNSQSGSDTALGFNGQIMVNGKALTITNTDTLNTLASKINGLKSGVTASIIGGSGSAYLSLTSTETGENNSMSLVDVSGGILNSLGVIGTGKGYRAGGFKSLGFNSITSSLQSLTGAAISGSFSINGHAISVDFATDSLQGIVSKINTSLNGTGVSAKLVEFKKGSETLQRIELDGLVLSLPSDPNGILSALGVEQNSLSHQVIAGRDASYTIDGIARTSESNIITDAISGGSITLLKDNSSMTSGTATTTINLTKDTDKIKSAFKSYMDSYNSLMDFVKSASGFDDKSFESGPLFGDTVTTQAVSQVQNALFQRLTSVGNYQSLADLGFSLDKDLKLELDESKLQTALDTDTDALRKLMTSFGTSSNDNLTFVGNTIKTKNPGTSGFKVDITTLATKSKTTALQAATNPMRGGETLTFAGKAFSTPVDIIVTAGKSLTEVAQLINSDSRTKDQVIASVDGNGKLVIEAKRYGSQPDFTVTSNLDEDVDTTGIGKSGGSYAKGLDIVGKINGEEAVGNGQYLTGKDTNATSAGLQIQYTGTSTGQVGIINFSQGLATQMLSNIDTLTDSSNGLFTSSNKSMESQIDELDLRIGEYNDRLKIREASLKAKFLAMEQAISTMQQQQQRLASIKF